jgi:invasion protein IalB
MFYVGSFITGAARSLRHLEDDRSSSSTAAVAAAAAAAAAAQSQRPLTVLVAERKVWSLTCL